MAERLTDVAEVTGPSRTDAAALDAADPLQTFQERFEPLPHDVVAYLDGNSLGRPARAVADVWRAFPDTWAARLIRGWEDGWIDLPVEVGDEVGAAVLGAAPGQTVVADSTTVCFAKALVAAVRMRPGRDVMVLDRDHFPTNRYTAESVAAQYHLTLRWHQGPLDQLALDERVAVVALGAVDYRTAARADLPGLTDAAHSVGALTVWDLSHAVGVLPVDLDAHGVDFAVGATYKFLGAGPGAPAFCYVAARHLDQVDQPIWGWLGRADPFEMAQGYVPAAGIRRMLSGTPPVPALLAVRAATALVAEAGIRAIREKSMELTRFTVGLVDAWLAPAGWRLVSPRDPDRAGGHVSLARSDARSVCAALAGSGVLADFREPDILRLGLSPLSVRFTEVWDALEKLRANGGVPG